MTMGRRPAKRSLPTAAQAFHPAGQLLSGKPTGPTISRASPDKPSSFFFFFVYQFVVSPDSTLVIDTGSSFIKVAFF